MEFLLEILIIMPIIIFSLTMHEVAHAYTSYKLGDKSVLDDNRLSFNPIYHIDPLGFLCLMIFRFGWAKPVMINPRYYKNKENGIFLVSIMGPLINLLIAIISIIIIKLFIVADNSNFIYVFFTYFWQLNIVLCVFNLLPFPPLDGSKLLIKVLPKEIYRDYTENQIIPIIMLVILFTTNIFSFILNPIFDFIYTLL